MDYLTEIQNLMTANDYDAYIVPTCDFHNSEYVSDYFKARQLLTGFTGSAGTLVITTTEAYLWVDGRYFIQADKEVTNKKIKVMKMGNPDVPTIEEFLVEYFKDVKRKTLGFDGRVIPTEFALKLKKLLGIEISFKTDIDLVNGSFDLSSVKELFFSFNSFNCSDNLLYFSMILKLDSSFF